MLTNSCVKLQTVHSIPLTINKEGGLSSQGLPSLSAVSTVFGTMGFLKECVCCLGPVGLSQEWMGQVRGGLSPAAGWLRRPMTLFLVTQHISDPLCAPGLVPLPWPPNSLLPAHTFGHAAFCVHSRTHLCLLIPTHRCMLVHMHAHARHLCHMPPSPFLSWEPYHVSPQSPACHVVNHLRT